MKIKAFTKKHYQQISRRLNKKIDEKNNWQHGYLCHNFLLVQKADNVFDSVVYLSTFAVQAELNYYGLKDFSGDGFGRDVKKANLRRLMLLDFIILSKSKD